MCNISQVGTLLQISCRGLTWLLWLQEAIKQAEEGRKAPLGRLNNMLMQMRNNCNHPDLITSKFDNSPTFPPADVLIAQCGKLQLLDRLLTKLKAKGHKVLIFSQVRQKLLPFHASNSDTIYCVGSSLANSPSFPPADLLIAECGKLQLLDLLSISLVVKGHRVIILLQVETAMFSFPCSDAPSQE